MRHCFARWLNTWRKEMGIINAAMRNRLPDSSFGLPSQRKYPLNDASHAANAKARAAQQVKAGNLSSGQAAQIRAKANRVLHKRK
jgi:hypothetical protein